MNTTNTPAATLAGIDRLSAAELDKLEELARAATPGPWAWWTSNSTTRLTGADGKDGGVLHGTAHRGYGDVACPKSNADFIAAVNPVAALELIALARRAALPVVAKPVSAAWDVEQVARVVTEEDKAALLEIVSELSWTVNGTWVITKSGEKLHTLDALAFARMVRVTLAQQAAAQPAQSEKAAAANAGGLADPTDEMLDMLGRVHPFAMEQEDRAKAYDRLERAFVIQQPWPVPDQACIVWRADLMDMRYDLVHKQACFDSNRASCADRIPAADADGLPDNYTVDDSELARRVMVFLGRATTASMEPGADPLRDRLAEKLAEWRARAPATSTASQGAAPADDAKDAARYRWLRDKSEPGICAFYLSVGSAFKNVKFARETVDEAIDAQITAMSAAKQERDK